MLLIIFNLLFLTIIIILNTAFCNGASYCNSEFCSNTKRPELCNFKARDPARHCIDYELTVRTKKEKMAILDKINSRRNKVASGDIRSFSSSANMIRLEWNTELEISAQSWANQCVKHSVPDIEDSCRDIGTITVGQNIATVFGESPGLSAATLVDVWYMELLNTNSSVISNYKPSANIGNPHFDYFTQLVWAETSEVGCGGVKFKELLKDTDKTNRTIYRLVCNFAPGGNHYNKTVYVKGIPCSKCPDGRECDPEYRALCSFPTQLPTSIHTTSIDNAQDSTQTAVLTVTSISGETDSSLVNDERFIKGILLSSSSAINTEDEEETTARFDYLSLLKEFAVTETSTTTVKPNECKDMMIIDDFVDLLKKKLINDPVLKTLLSTGNASLENSNSENTFTDSNVAAFVRRVYSSKEPSSTVKTTHNDYINSTLLVDLVEAVIFGSGDKISASKEFQLTTQPINVINPIKIQAELAEIQTNQDFTGHYFFPEDDSEETSEATDVYYDSSDIPITDVVLEIEELIKSSSKDFLDEILLDELEPETESTTTLSSMSPDDMKLHKQGYQVMKKFLNDIGKGSHTEE